VIARRLRQRQPSRPLSPVPLPPVPAVFALSERGGKKGLCYPAFPPASGFPVRTISRPFYWKRSARWTPYPAPHFKGEGLTDQTLVG
jgi:hypothetical protein